MNTPFKCSRRCGLRRAHSARLETSARPPHEVTRCAPDSAGTPANGDPA
jgi:hypothetical protein